MDDFKRPVKKQPVVGYRPVQKFVGDMTVPKQRPIQRPTVSQPSVPQRTVIQPAPNKPPITQHTRPQSATVKPILKQYPTQPQRAAVSNPALRQRVVAKQAVSEHLIAQTSDNPTKAKEPEKISFFNKHKKALIIAAAVLVIITGICTTLYYITPVISINNEKLVNLDVEFKLQQYQIAKLKSGGVSVEIQHFSNSTCPVTSKCYTSEKAVQYMLTVNGQKYATGTADKVTGGDDYRIETVSTDYKSYANIKITKS